MVQVVRQELQVVQVPTVRVDLQALQEQMDHQELAVLQVLQDLVAPRE
jgi:hypothetical protein